MMYSFLGKGWHTDHTEIKREQSGCILLPSFRVFRGGTGPHAARLVRRTSPNTSSSAR